MKVLAAMLLSLTVLGTALLYVRHEKARCDAFFTLQAFFERLSAVCTTEKTDTLCRVRRALGEASGFYEALCAAYEASGSLVLAWQEAVRTGPFAASLQQPALSFLEDFSQTFESVSEEGFLRRCKEAADYFGTAGEALRQHFAQRRRMALSFGVFGAVLVFIVVV